MCIEKNINNLKKYIEEDEIYSKYKNGEYETLSDFELFCVNHCKDIEELLKDYTKQKQMYLDEVDKTTDVTLLYNGLLNKIKNKIEELSNTKGDFATYIAVSERIKALEELL